MQPDDSPSTVEPKAPKASEAPEEAELNGAGASGTVDHDAIREAAALVQRAEVSVPSAVGVASGEWLGPEPEPEAESLLALLSRLQVRFPRITPCVPPSRAFPASGAHGALPRCSARPRCWG
jgi:hypothetical protein